MRVISDRPLRAFCETYPTAREPLWFWRGVITRGTFGCFADMKMSFHAVDKVGAYYVFNIGGNKFRVIASIHFNTQVLYVKEVLTHGEYDKWRP